VKNVIREVKKLVPLVVHVCVCTSQTQLAQIIVYTVYNRKLASMEVSCHTNYLFCQKRFRLKFTHLVLSCQ